MKENNWILIGYVNQFYTKQLNLAALSLETEEHLWIYNKKINQITQHAHGVAGIKKIEKKYLIAYQSRPVVFVFLNEDFTFHSSFSTRKIDDVHSISYSKEGIYVTSTGNDSVFKLLTDSNFNIISVKRIWRHQLSNPKKDSDQLHVNSICNYKNSLYISCFGHSPSEKHDKTNKKGHIIELNSNKVIYNNVGQPHTLNKVDNKLCFLESSEGTLHFIDGKKVNINGYLRGMSTLKNEICIGVSGKRIKSKSKKSLNFKLTNKEEKAEIVVLDKNTLKVKKNIQLGTYGNEIYDIIPLLNFNPNKFRKKNESIQIQLLKDKINRLVDESISKTKNNRGFSRIIKLFK
ncbi:MAG: DUF4915 domain-containing protein [Parvicellaceae bacterium]